MASYYLFLDDERMPWDVTWCDIPRDKAYTIVENYDKFVGMVQAFGVPEFVSFDHDLAQQHYGHGLNNDEIPYARYTEKTGYDCAKWLVDFCSERGVKFPAYKVHSMNPVGTTNITTYIENAKKHLNI